MRSRSVLAGAGALAGAAALVGPRLWRAMLDWGATADEARRPLPGDELLPDADLVATRAISIGAAPADVWPWLVQLGVGRAGAYSYDWLDRLFGLDVRSSRRIVPELQGLAVGDVIPVANDGTGLRVRILERERVLGALTDDGTWAWTWVLEPAGAGTRLLSRTRMITARILLARAATWLALVPASWVMERRMLLGLRERAEDAPARSRRELPAGELPAREATRDQPMERSAGAPAPGPARSRSRSPRTCSSWDRGAGRRRTCTSCAPAPRGPSSMPAGRGMPRASKPRRGRSWGRAQPPPPSS